MSFKPFTEKIEIKKIGICSIRIRVRIKKKRIRNTGLKDDSLMYFLSKSQSESKKRPFKKPGKSEKKKKVKLPIESVTKLISNC